LARFPTIPAKAAKTSYYNTNKKQWKIKNLGEKWPFFDFSEPRFGPKIGSNIKFIF